MIFGNGSDVAVQSCRNVQGAGSGRHSSQIVVMRTVKALFYNHGDITGKQANYHSQKI